MNKLLATLVAGTFAVVASSAFAQAGVAGTPSAGMKKEAAKDPKGAAAAYANPGAEQTQAQKSQAGAAEVAKSKEQARTKSKYDEKAAQQLSESGTNPAQAKANVAASKEQSAKREKMPDLSKLTKEQKNELYRRLQKEATGG